MARKVPVTDRIAKRLAHEIEAGAWPIGGRMDTVRDLADRFETSVRTVHLALGELETRGYIVRKQGSGTYVARTEPELTMSDTVVLCVEATGHVFGDLASMLCKGLHSHGMLPMTADMATTDVAEKRQVIRRAVSGQAPIFIAHVNTHFPADELLAPPFQSKTIVGIVDWHTDLLTDRAHRVIVDHAEGGRIVARHLIERGHRHVLVTGSENMIDDITRRTTLSGLQGREFARLLQDSGGRITTLVANVDLAAEPSVDADALLSMMNSHNPPTAIFGMLDAAAWACRRVLAERAPTGVESVEIVGYGNTPWSRTTHPAFTSMDWNIDVIARETLDIVSHVRRGEVLAPRYVEIVPRMVARPVAADITVDVS